MGIRVILLPIIMRVSFLTLCSCKSKSEDFFNSDWEGYRRRYFWVL